MKLSFLIIVFVATVFADVQIKNIKTDEFPKIKFDILSTDFPYGFNTIIENLAVKDGNGNSLPNMSFSNHTLKQNIIILLDISGSMSLKIDEENIAEYPNRRIDYLINSLKNMIEQINFPEHEISIIQYSRSSNLALKATSSKDSLNGFLNSEIILRTTTDFNNLFLGENILGQPNNGNASVFKYIEENKFLAPTVFFFSDGNHGVFAPEDFMYNKVADEILENDINLISFCVGSESSFNLEQLSTLVNGEYYDNLISEQEINQAISDALESMNLNSKYSRVNLEVLCNKNYEINLNFDSDNSDFNHSFDIEIPESDFDSYDLSNTNLEFNFDEETEFQIISKRDSLEISSIKIDSETDGFELLNFSATKLNYNDTLTVELIFNSDTSNTEDVFGDLTIESNYCKNNNVVELNAINESILSPKIEAVNNTDFPVMRFNIFNSDSKVAIDESIENLKVFEKNSNTELTVNLVDFQTVGEIENSYLVEFVANCQMNQELIISFDYKGNNYSEELTQQIPITDFVGYDVKFHNSVMKSGEEKTFILTSFNENTLIDSVILSNTNAGFEVVKYPSEILNEGDTSELVVAYNQPNGITKNAITDIIIHSNMCSENSVINIEGEFVSSVSKNEADFSIYPNPSSDFINVISKEEPNSFRIFDLNSNLITEREYNKDQINISHLSSGTYILELKIKNKTKRVAFIKI